MSLPFSREQIRDFLKQAGYTANPEGLVHKALHEYVISKGDSAYLEIVPKRP